MQELPLKTRQRIALVVAVCVDAIQIGLPYLFIEGIASPFSDILDVLAFLFFWRLIGWHFALLPSFAIKIIPFAVEAPTWTIAVLIAARSRKEPPSATVPPVLPASNFPDNPKTEGKLLHTRLNNSEFAPANSLHQWRWPIALILVSLIVAGTVLSLWKNFHLFPGLHLDEKLTTAFIASIPEVQSAGLGRLELATATATETFTRSDYTESWGIYLGTTYVEMRVPVTYRYHLQLADPWQLYVNKDVCIVKAPAIHPSLPPAIHTDGIERLSENGWARFNKDEEMVKLEKDVTPTLSRYAADRRHIKLVREDCRKTVANFVKAFLLRTTDQEASKFNQIIVVFDDEPFKSAEAMPPTIRLHSGQ